MLEELAVLGLAGDVTPQQVKRAYLRKVKEHPPERDPEGFQRVRGAYEAALAGLMRRALKQGAEGPASAPEAAPEALTTEAASSADSADSADSAEPAHAAAEAAAAEAAAAGEAGTEPGPRFPEYVSHQIEQLNRAIENEDAEGAASAMIELYSRPVLEEAPVPPALFALRTFMVLAERERFVPARKLLEAFEAHTSNHQTSFGGGGEISARFRLAREVLATSELDGGLAAALALGLRRGRLFEAREAAQEARIRYPRRLEPHLRENAPTLWASIEPLLQPQRQGIPPTPSWGWAGSGSWSIGIVIMVMFQLLRVCTTHQTSSRNVPYPPAPIVVERHNPPEPPDPLPASSVPSPLPWEAMPHEHAPDATDATELKRDGSWMAISLSLAAGDCEGVRAQWPLYRAALSKSHVDEQLERSRRAEVLQMCAELKNMVEPEE